MRKIITSESVNCGHPDKTCDIIADSFLDEALKQDPNSMMAVECAIKDNKVFVYGEATTKAVIDYDKIVREVLSDIGYDADYEYIKPYIASNGARVPTGIKYYRITGKTEQKDYKTIMKIEELDNIEELESIETL